MTQAGRRPGSTETRGEILSAARRQFAAKGYNGTTIRSIAAEAGVNPALVHHFFGTKERVFAAVLDFPLDPAEILQTVAAGPRDEVGQRVARVFLAAWSHADSRTGLLTLLRSVTTNEQAAVMFRQFVETVLLRRVADALGIPPLHLTAAAGQMVGIALLRYVIGVEPLASVDDEDIVRLVAPAIQHYIDGA